MSLFTVDNLLALLALTSLEIALGIDNIIVLSVIVGKLDKHRQALARRVGLGLAMFGRIALLLCIGWVMRLTTPLFIVFGNEFTGRDLILLPGGLFLIAKATHEIHEKFEGLQSKEAGSKPVRSFWAAIGQILLLDLVFSLDSVITAVGIAKHVPVMIAAIVIAVLIMMAFARAVGDFIDHHPTLKMLALSFLLLIGFVLVAEGLGREIDKGYIYFAMGFSLLVEFLNLKLEKSRV